MDSPTTVVIGMLGPTLDNGAGARALGRWRPTVAAASTRTCVVEPLRAAASTRASRALARRWSPKTSRRSRPRRRSPRAELALRDPWDFEEVYGALHDFARAYPFDPEREDYLVHITTGTHVAQICLFLLAESRHLPARLQTSRRPAATGRAHGARGHLRDHRPRPLPLRPPRLALRRRARRGAVVPQGRASRRATPPSTRSSSASSASPLRTRAPMLLTGPTGAGKSQLARRIYELKRARHLKGAFVEVNCATLRGDGAMSTLFGHAKGAFTDARQRPRGALQRGRRRRAVPRRDRRARPRRAGDAAARARGEGLLPRRRRPRGVERLRAHRGHQPRPRRRRAAGHVVPRRSPRAHRPVDVPRCPASRERREDLDPEPRLRDHYLDDALPRPRSLLSPPLLLRPRRLPDAGRLPLPSPPPSPPPPEVPLPPSPVALPPPLLRSPPPRLAALRPPLRGAGGAGRRLLDSLRRPRPPGVCGACPPPPPSSAAARPVLPVALPRQALGHRPGPPVEVRARTTLARGGREGGVGLVVPEHASSGITPHDGRRNPLSPAMASRHRRRRPLRSSARRIAPRAAASP